MENNPEQAVPGIDGLDEDTGEIISSRAKPAINVLSVLRNGQIMDLLSLEMNRVVAGVRDCSDDKAGEVTLKLRIVPVKRIPNAVQIQTQVIGKAPEDPPSPDLFFFDDDANLHTRDPNQRDMFPFNKN